MGIRAEEHHRRGRERGLMARGRAALRAVDRVCRHRLFQVGVTALFLGSIAFGGWWPDLATLLGVSATLVWIWER